MTRLKLLGCSCVLALAVLTAPAFAQYMYLDANGDGINTSADSLRVPGETTVDIWLRTDQNRNGSSVTCPAMGSAASGTATAMSFLSYEFILHANGGTVSWGPFTNLVSSMANQGSASDSTDLYVGYGFTQLGPGLYKLGTVQVTVVSGQPSLSIVAGTPLSGAYYTAFGSGCGGSGGKNTIQLGTDWHDADGLQAPAFIVYSLDNFESGTIRSSVWNVADYNTGSGYDSWAARTAPCQVYSGSYAASGSGDGSQPCGQYDANQDSWVWTNGGYDESGATSYYVAFAANHNLAAGDSLSIWRYDYGSNQWVKNFGMGGSSGGWVLKATPLIYNDNHQEDYLAIAFNLNTGTGPKNGGAYIDNVSLYEQPRAQPNLTFTTPAGWSGPIVASYRTGTTTTEILTAGQDAYIDWGLKNNGSASSGTFTVNYYLDGVNIGSNTLSLLAGEVFPRTDLAVYVGSSGNHTLRMVIDSLGQVPEFNEADNAYQQTFFWNPPGKANLVVPLPVSVSNPTPSLGDAVAVSLLVRNIGNSSANNFQVGLYFNRNTAPTTVDTPNMTQLVTLPLSPGGETTVTFSVSNATAGNWQTYVLVDATGVIDESSEGDNVGGPRSINWTAGVFTVRGTFAYDDSVHGNAETHTPCAVVEVWHDDDVLADSLLATGVLGTDGSYQIGPITNVDATPPPGGDARLNVFVRWKFESRERCWNSSYPDTPIVRMKIGDDEDRWSFRTPTIPHIPNRTYNVGLMKPSTYAQKSAAHIFDVIQRTWRWFGHDYRSLFGSPGPVNVRWLPGFTPTTDYNPLDSTIFIDGINNAATGSPDEWDDWAITHEYGHHVNWTLGRVSYPTDSLAQHTLAGPCISLRQAWDEGVADLVGCGFGLSSGMYDDFGRDPDGTRRHVVHVDLERGEVVYYMADGTPYPTLDRNAAGPAHELCIASMLWDVQDNVPDNPNGDAFGDSLWGGWGTIFEEVCHWSAGKLHTVYDFDKEYLRLWGDADFRIDAQFVFYEHGLFSDTAGVATGVATGDFSRSLALHGGTPNPFNPRTRIRFELPASDIPREFAIQVFDARGCLVRELLRGIRGKGLYTIEWDGTNGVGASVASGVYFVQLTWGEQQRTKRVTLLR